MKYEMLLNDKKVTSDGVVVYRIKSTTNFTCQGLTIREGELGGYVQNISNLGMFDSSWIADDAIVYGKASISEEALVMGNASVKDSEVLGKSVIRGHSVVVESTIIDSTVQGNALVKNSSLKESSAGGNSETRDSTMFAGEISDNAQILKSSITDNSVVDGNTILEDCRIGNGAVLSFEKEFNIFHATIFGAHIFNGEHIFTTTLYNDEQSTAYHPVLYTFYVHEPTNSTEKVIRFASNVNLCGSVDYFKEKERSLYDFVTAIFKNAVANN